ncbi:MAG: DNA polymerase I [Nitrospinae bacterium RIFCSPLOWO2_12_39_16]|nr:MAG: DNA polymerase I [Nitrospinae bacterium RIFCSPLOWO2_12_39_16]
MQKKPRLYIIDGSSYVYRAFYAIPHLTNSRGLPTNAIYGFARMILKIIRDEKPDYLAIAFDSKGETFRHKEYAEYKAHRPEMPDELVPQIPYIHKLVEAFNIPILQNEGYEADDLIGSAVREASSKGFDVIIVSGDKDMLQLITPSIMMLDTLKNKTYGEKEVVEKFGVGPDKVVEVIGLMGDASDNIPGVPGIGEKTAIALIKEFGNIENLLNNIEKVSKPSIREKLKEHTEQALLSRRLGVINKDVELNTPVEALILKDVCIDELTELLKELEFHTLLKEILSNKDKSKREYRITTKEGDFNKLLEDITSSHAIAIDIAGTNDEPMRADIVGISISLKPHEAFYIPIGQMDKKYVIEKLKPILENESIKKYGQNIKYETIILANEGIGLNGIDFDTEIASYLINPSSSRNQVTEIGEKASSPIKDFSLLKIEEVMNRSCEDADTAYQLKEKLEPILKEDGLIELFHKVEIPLIEVLSEMERNGVKIDEPFLREMSRRLDTQLNKLTERIYFIAGIEFNINSPKQLQEILFEKLKLKPAKRTKTGLSTDVEVLQQLSVQHDLPAIILEYRQLSKLKSTYVDALINMINPKTNRIHTSFNQTVTATGRLSSSDPNLQNIPIRTEIGREIRKSFVAESGALILSADYSQIELRILAHVSQDDVLIDAFKKGEDIHERTACEVFGVLPGMVTPEMRRMAKAVNFGIIYGISPFGLSRDLGISKDKAKEYIDNYFSRHKGVKDFIDKTLKESYEKGYVTTLLQRRRYLPDLKSKNRQVKEFAERTAINTPIQGSAADMIKLAMINIHRRIKDEGRRAKMIIQVHDELVFEVSEDEIEQIKKLVKEKMEGVMNLSVPIIAEIHTGKNWNEAH